MPTTTTPFNAHAVTLPRSQWTSAEYAYWALRIGSAMCFIGHGAFGFITKGAWLPYFGVVGIPERLAWTLMPLIGAVDVTAGMAVLFAPRALPLLYMSIWAFWTALLRPLSGESVFEAVERAGNYGVPLAMLLMTALPLSLRSIHRRLDGAVVNKRTFDRVTRVLTWTTALLLFGHGALGGLTHKPLLASHYAMIGLPAGVEQIVGWFEMMLAVVVLLRPAVGLLVFIGAWKVATESLYVVAGAPVWELVERAGSYVAPLALAALMRETTDANGAVNLRQRTGSVHDSKQSNTL
jgi:hypothetical protein